MAKTKSKSRTKKAANKPKPQNNAQTVRRVKSAPKLSSSFSLLVQSLKLLKIHWKLFALITLIYGALTIVLVRGLGSGISLDSLKATLHEDGSSNSLATGITLFGYLLGGAGGANSQAGGIYQTLLVILLSLVTIWALRQVLAGKQIRVRDAFYKGTYPLVPFILVLLVVGLQLLPLVVGSWLFATVSGAGVAVNVIEKFGWGLLFFLLSLWSLYMISSSVFGLYIVTLPDMTPLKALRSAKQLVKHRRFKILRKLLFLPFALIIAGAIITIPLILILTSLATWVFFLLSMFGLIVVHSYLYMLYRELL